MHPDRRDFFLTYRLRFTQPMALNDPYECLPAISKTDYDKLIESAIKSDERIVEISKITRNRKARRAFSSELERAKNALKKENEKSRKIEKIFINTYKKAVNERVGILCLSKRSDSSLMWPHYTDSHKGFVLGFNSNHNFFQKQPNDPKDIGTLEEVKYSPDRIPVDMANIHITSELFLIKNEEWSYEEEMRLVRHLTHASQVIKNQEPYIYLFDIPKDSISSIIFGMNASDETQKEILKIVKTDNMLRNVPLFQAYMDNKTFKIQTRKIS